MLTESRASYYPTHDRTSCSDTDRCNTIDCRRCTALELDDLERCRAQLKSEGTQCLKLSDGRECPDYIRDHGRWCDGCNRRQILEQPEGEIQ